MKNSVTAQLGPIMPIGGIIIWSGSADSFDSSGLGIGSMIGWAICNGNNTTPDLLDSFVVGAGNSYSPGQTGGSAEVTLNEGNLPSHSHTINSSNFGTLGIGLTPENGSVYIPFVTQPGLGPTGTDFTGSGNNFSIMPPYYALYYIIKIA